MLVYSYATVKAYPSALFFILRSKRQTLSHLLWHNANGGSLTTVVIRRRVQGPIAFHAPRGKSECIYLKARRPTYPQRESTTYDSKAGLLDTDPSPLFVKYN
ncbi:hypothetical protein EVAR_65097_1 [Eumeta japonica]|uniref:Uncharacterized protein n=1 Tax=Eumeta variegata TaxID=151549 RepID=A0A4C1Z4S8_EUMVA|nr:hypothetical protein EVAR_65097_1 [Eumeta japonica]